MQSRKGWSFSKNIDKNKGPNGPFLILFCCVLVLDMSYHNQVVF
ncbi:hypothetical protein CPL00379_CDS0002 [Klebsiella phage StarXobjector]